MEKLKSKQSAFTGSETLNKEQMKKVIGGGAATDVAYCTYVMQNGGMHTEEGIVSNPADSGYASAREFAEAMCASDPMCVSVTC